MLRRDGIRVGEKRVARLAPRAFRARIAAGARAARSAWQAWSRSGISSAVTFAPWRRTAIRGGRGVPESTLLVLAPIGARSAGGGRGGGPWLVLARVLGPVVVRCRHYALGRRASSREARACSPAGRGVTR